MNRFKKLLFFRLKNMLGIPQLKYMMKNNEKSQLYLAGFLLLFLIVAASLLAPYFLILNFAYEATEILGDTTLFISLLTSSGQILLLFTGILYCFNSMYTSRDSEFLLSLPFPRGYLFLSSYIMSYIMNFFTSLLLLVPGLVVYLNKSGDISVFIKGLILSILYPIIPVSLSMIIVIPIMYAVNRFKHKDIIATVAGFVLMVLFITANMAFSSSMQEGQEAEFLAKLFSERIDLPKLTKGLVPYSAFMKEFLVNEKIGGATSFVVLAVLSAFVVVVAYMLCRRLYESLQQKIGHAGKKEKAVDIHAIKVGNPRLAFCKKEIKLILRSPVYALNCLLNIVLGPLAVISIFKLSTNSEEAVALDALVESFRDKPYVLLYIFYGFVMFLTSLNFAPSTTFSREGEHFWLTKVIPVPYMEQIKGRIYASVIFYLCCSVTMTVILQFFIRLELLYFLAVNVLILASVLQITYISMAVDLIKPKLHWSTEAEAVKRNFNAVIGMLLSLVLVVINALPVFLSVKVNANLGIVLSLVISIAIAILSRYVLMRLVNERYELINV
jgi:ABC-2 type transport system permease protein